MLTAEEVRDILDYDATTGIFTWRHYRMSSIGAGDRAGGLMGEYRRVHIKDRTYAEHRLAWLYVNGEWPPGMIDHINCNKTDNRIANLRVATRSQNAANSCGRGPHGKGVWLQKNGRFGAKIRAHGDIHHLGTFDTAPEAHAAYRQAAVKFYGDFARFE